MVKKNSFAGEKERLPTLREKLLFTLAKLVFFNHRGLEGEAGRGY
jgi:hypothetical protein